MAVLPVAVLVLCLRTIYDKGTDWVFCPGEIDGESYDCICNQEQPGTSRCKTPDVPEAYCESLYADREGTGRSRESPESLAGVAGKDPELSATKAEPDEAAGEKTTAATTRSTAPPPSTTTTAATTAATPTVVEEPSPTAKEPRSAKPADADGDVERISPASQELRELRNAMHSFVSLVGAKIEAALAASSVQASPTSTTEGGPSAEAETSLDPRPDLRSAVSTLSSVVLLLVAVVAAIAVALGSRWYARRTAAWETRSGQVEDAEAGGAVGEGGVTGRVMQYFRASDHYRRRGSPVDESMSVRSPLRGRRGAAADEANAVEMSVLPRRLSSSASSSPTARGAAEAVAAGDKSEDL